MHQGYQQEYLQPILQLQVREMLWSSCQLMVVSSGTFSSSVFLLASCGEMGILGETKALVSFVLLPSRNLLIRLHEVVVCYC